MGCAAGFVPHRTRLRTPLFVRPGALAARQRATSSSERRQRRPHLRAPHAVPRRGSPTPATSATPTTNARRPHRQASRLSASSAAAAWRTCPHDSATATCKVFQLNPSFSCRISSWLASTPSQHRSCSPAVLPPGPAPRPFVFLFSSLLSTRRQTCPWLTRPPRHVSFIPPASPLCDPSPFLLPKQRTRPRPSVRRRLQRGAGGLAPA